MLVWVLVWYCMHVLDLCYLNIYLINSFYSAFLLSQDHFTNPQHVYNNIVNNVMKKNITI